MILLLMQQNIIWNNPLYLKNMFFNKYEEEPGRNKVSVFNAYKINCISS